MKQSIHFLKNNISEQYPFVLADVGAMGDVSVDWDIFGEKLRVIAFEPDEREFIKLKNTDHKKFLNCLLYSHSEDLQFYCLKEPGRSSILKPNYSVLSAFPNAERYAIVKTIPFPKSLVKSLDELKKDGLLTELDFLKVDTQGTELDILKGGISTLKNVFGIFAEVEFLELYQNQGLFGDVDSFLKDHGFELIDLRRVYWKRKDFYRFIGKGQLIFGDSLYFKRADVFLAELKKNNPEYCLSKIIKAIVICLIYGAYDYAISLLNAAKRDGFVEEEFGLKLEVAIKRVAHSRARYKFFGKNFLFKVFNRLAEIFMPPSYLGWADGDRKVVNKRQK